MKILLVSPEYPPKIGGIGRSTTRLGHSFAGAGYPTTILTYDRSADLLTPPYVRKDPETQSNLTVLRVGPIAGKRTGVSPETKATLKRQFLAEALRALSSDPPDVVLSLGLVDAGFIGLAIAQSLMRPHVVSARGADVGTEIFQGDKFPFAQSVVTRSSAITFVNKYLFETAAAVFGRMGKYVVIKNAVADPGQMATSRRASLRQSIRQQLRIPLASKVIGWTGTFREKKGIRVLDDAFKSLVDQGRDVFWLVVGGPRNEHEAALCSSFRAANAYGERIRCAGLLETPTDVLPYYPAMDVFVYPSLDDGMSNSLLEAMVFGLPVVATDIFADVAVQGQTAFLVPRFDTSALVAATAQILDDPDLSSRLGRQARDSMLSQFSAQAECDSYLTLFQRLLKERKLQ